MTNSNIKIAYNIPNIVAVLKAIRKLQQMGIFNFEAMLRHVDIGIAHQRARTQQSIPMLATRKTVEKYIKQCRDINDFNDPQQIRPIKNIMEAIPENAYRLMREYIERVSPDFF